MNLVLEELKAVTIDPYDTLVDAQKIWMETVRTVLDKYIYQIDVRIRTGIDADIFYRYWQEKIKEAKKEQFNGYMPLLSKTLSATFEDFGFTGDEKDVNVLTDKWGKMPLFPEIEESLAELKKQYAVGLITEVDDTLLQKTLAPIKTNFDVVVTSNTAKAFRPTPTLYLKAIESLKCKPNEALHVTASKEDLFGARFVRMRTGWINRTGEKLEGSKPDIEARDLKDLSEQLKKT